MADLIVLGFESKDVAEEVFRLGTELRQQELVDLAEGALAWQDDDGNVRIQQAISVTGVSAASGGLWGTLIGCIFLVPRIGLAAGAASGAAAGRLAEVGIDDELTKEIVSALSPGKAAVFALVRKSTPDRVRQATRSYQPTVLHTPLSTGSEEELVAALQG